MSNTRAFEIALAFLREKERFVGHTYDDMDPKARPLAPGQACRGTPTIGYGHTGRHAKPGATMTPEQAERVLVEDLTPCERALPTLVASSTLAQLDAYQTAALLSFMFNVGITAFGKSTLAKKLNKGDLTAFPAEAPRWNKATVGGKKVTLDGLVSRRAEEVLLWQTPATAEDADEAQLVPIGATPTQPKPLADSSTVQGIGLGALGSVVGLVVQLLGGLGTLPAAVQMVVVGTTGATVLGLAIALRGRIRLRRLEHV
jgi:lysozyme